MVRLGLQLGLNVCLRAFLKFYRKPSVQAAFLNGENEWQKKKAAKRRLLPK